MQYICVQETSTDQVFVPHEIFGFYFQLFVFVVVPGADYIVVVIVVFFVVIIYYYCYCLLLFLVLFLSLL